MAKGGSFVLLAMLALAAYVTSPSFVGGVIKASDPKVARHSIAPAIDTVIPQGEGFEGRDIVDIRLKTGSGGMEDGVMYEIPGDRPLPKDAYVMVTLFSTGARVRIFAPLTRTMGELKKQAVQELGYAQSFIPIDNFKMSQSEKPGDYYPDSSTLADYKARTGDEFTLWFNP